MLFPLRPDSNDIAEWVNLEVMAEATVEVIPEATVEVIPEAKKVTIGLYLNYVVYACILQ